MTSVNHRLDAGQTPESGASHEPARFVLLFLELQIPMVLGASVCFLLGRLVPASSGFATAYHPGTFLFAIGDVLFLTVPVVAWMIVRGHGRRHSLEMALAMVAPVAMIAVVGELAGYAYLLWLVTAMYPAMCLGLLVYMRYRRDQFTGWDHLRQPSGSLVITVLEDPSARQFGPHGTSRNTTRAVSSIDQLGAPRG